MPHIHEFSSGYYLINGLFVVETDSVSVPKIHDRLYAQIQEDYYDQAPVPILFRHTAGNSHFRVEPSGSIGPEIMQVPTDIVDTFESDATVGTDQFLISKPSYSETIVTMSSMHIRKIGQ